MATDCLLALLCLAVLCQEADLQHMNQPMPATSRDSQAGQPSVGTNSYEPEQVHLSYHNDPTAMQVTWVTKEEVDSRVLFGVGNLNSTAWGTASQFTSGTRDEVIHRVTLTDLTPGLTYEYVVGSEQGWSDLKSFTAMPSGTDWSPRLAVFGDMGVEGARALERLQLDTALGMYDAVLHIGDIAYNLEHDDGKVGDEFLRMVEPVAGRVPYMVAPGNHEREGNFSEYKARFTMPGNAENMFYTLEMGPVQMVVISTEFYYYLEFGTHMAINQYHWLENVLQESNTPENRALRPWLVIYGHHPMYCSNFSKSKDCLSPTNLLRVGIPEEDIPGLEPLLMQYGVDLVLWGHVHAYERLWPVFADVVFNGTTEEPYTNPGAPVHIITGSAGADSHAHYPTDDIPPDFSAYCSIDYGFTRLTFHNSTHLSMEQVSEDQDGAVIDSAWLKKTVHAPYHELTKTQQGYVKL